MENNINPDEWRQAFDGAEVQPSDAVWTRVELDLERMQGSRLRRRLILFQGLAAASLVFAMSVAGIYFFAAPSDPVSLAHQTPSASEPNQDFISEKESEGPPAEREQSRPPEFTSSSGKESTPFKQSKDVLKVTGVTLTSPEDDTFASATGTQNNYYLYPVTLKVTTKQASDLHRPPTHLFKKNPEPDAGQVLLAQLKAEEEQYRKEDQQKGADNSLWTSVGVSAGSFNPNMTTPSAVKAFGGTSNNPESGASYTLGVQVGGRLSRRLILQGGLSYLSQNASYTSSAVSVQANASRASLNEFADNSVDVVAASPYDVNSNLQYLSVPVQVGYILLDKSFGIQVNGGLATDFFIQNTLEPQAVGIDKVTQQAGEESPYRTVNFSGLLGTEFSYRMGDHYRISVNPGLRYALQSMYKPQVTADVAPITYDVALRIKYMFN
jgi:hypothetical protein